MRQDGRERRIAPDAHRTAASVLSGAGLLAIGSAFSQLCTAALLIAIARRVGPSGFGPLSAIYGLFAISLDVIDFGGNSHVARTIARTPEDSAIAEVVWRHKFAVAILASLVWVTVGAALPQRANLLLPFAFLLLLSAGSQSLQGVARGRSCFGALAIASIMERFATLIIGVLIILAGADPLVSLPIGLIAGSIVSGLFLLTRLSISTRYFAVWPRLTLKVAQEIYPLGLIGVLTDVQQSDAALVQLCAGSSAAGIFAAPARLVSPLALAATSLGTALFSAVPTMPDVARAKTLTLRVGSVLVLLMIVPLTLIAIVAGPLVRLVLGPSFHGAVWVLRIYCLSVFLVSLNQPMCALLLTTGHERLVSKTIAFGVLLSCVAVCIGSLALGATGGALGFLALQVIIIGSVARGTMRL